MIVPDPLYVAFDLETTGLQVVRDRIVTATVVGHPEVDIDVLMNPCMDIPSEATAVHGITTEYAARNGVDYADGLYALGNALTAAWRMGATVVGHNILGFDLPMLRMQERQVFGKFRTEFGPILDTYGAYTRAYPGHPAKLVDACAHLGIELDNAHDAHADAQAALDLAVMLITS